MKEIKNFRILNTFRLAISITLLITILISCNNDETVSSSSLQAYIDLTGMETQKDSLIACAASGQSGILSGDSSKSVSILYYPLDEISDVKYFESSNSDINALQFYEEKSLTNSQLLNGILRRFNRDAPTTQTSAIVTFIRNSKVFLSNPIVIKSLSNPTNFNSEIEIKQNNSLMPSFSWNNATTDADAIYFQIVSDINEQLVSGTYTFEPLFQFYDLSNVVLNITEEETPTLKSNETYRFTVMGVSEDNWVNFISEDSFIAF